jgi:hypothetical protein
MSKRRTPQLSLPTGLSHFQRALILDAASRLPIDRRGLFTQRVAADLRVHCGGYVFRNNDIEAAINRSLRGLRQEITA